MGELGEAEVKKMKLKNEQLHAKKLGGKEKMCRVLERKRVFCIKKAREEGESERQKIISKERR